MSLPDYDPRGNKDVGDISEPEHGASIGRIVEWLFDLVRWLRQREPVTPGDPFTKFATRGYLVSKGLLTEKQVLGDDDDGGEDDGGAADAPEYVYVHAREMYPSVTDGSDVLTVTELTAAKPNIQYLAFNALAASSADFQLIMPEGWPGNAFTFRIYWAHPTGAGSPTVVWRFQAHSAGDGEDIGSDFADGGMTTDTGGTGNRLYITDQSNPITISGINAKAGDLIFCRITREATNAADTLTTEARLFAMRFDLGEAQVEFPSAEVSGALLLFGFNSTDGDTTIVNEGTLGGTGTCGAGCAISTGVAGPFGGSVFRGTHKRPVAPIWSSVGANSSFSKPSGRRVTVEGWANVFSDDSNDAPILFDWVNESTLTSIARVYWDHNDGGVGLSIGASDNPGLAGPDAASWFFFHLVIDESDDLELWVDGALVYSSGSFAANNNSGDTFKVCFGGSALGATDTATTAFHLDECRYSLDDVISTTVPSAIFTRP